MRPLRLSLDGFGSYREPAEADFSDVDFFALVGPTGSGKSTVIDGLCFALYGTVPRWGRENVIAQALAPAANACRVCLVFEASGKRYAAVRALTRDARGQVHTKEARLERLDQDVPPGAPLAELLAGNVEPLAEGPDQVKAQVQEILGLTYEHFTQSVLLPQGRFSEFLQAEPRKRQDLLVELLAFGVYEKVGHQARRRAELAAERVRSTDRLLAELAGATEQAQEQAAARVHDLKALAAAVDEGLRTLAELADQARSATVEAEAGRGALALLGAVRTPAEVPGLARRIVQAQALLTDATEQCKHAEETEAIAQQARAELPDLTSLELLAKDHAERRQLAALLDRQDQALKERQDAAQEQAAAVEAADGQLVAAREARQRAEREHAAAALAEDLRVGDECPVCRKPVTVVPHHAAPADLTQARQSEVAADQRLSQARTAYHQAASAAAVASSAADGTRQRLEEVAARLAGAPPEPEIAATLEAIRAADDALGQAQEITKARRTALDSAERQRSALSDEERRAWSELTRSRDCVVSLGAPSFDNAELSAAWDALANWARGELEQRTSSQRILDETVGTLKRQLIDAQSELRTLLASHSITGINDLARAAAEVATHLERAANHLATIQADRERAATLQAEVQAQREEQQVASKLGQLLRANTFERWICGEALDSLMVEASATLMELSAGQYQLARDERNDLTVIDYADAGARRPVHTLSGGETFQASLALALALSRQVVGLSAGMRDLNSMFLDEGFGTLDEDTLETVGSTLERLASDSERMIGIVTHVQALAERVPVRFVVSRTGATSALRKERV